MNLRHQVNFLLHALCHNIVYPVYIRIHCFHGLVDGSDCIVVHFNSSRLDFLIIVDVSAKEGAEGRINSWVHGNNITNTST